MTKDRRLLIFSGVNRRYKYLANHLLESFPQSALIIQTNYKGDYKGMYDKNPEYDPDVINLLNLHLEKRDEIERCYYPHDFFELSQVHSSLEVNSNSLNSDSVCDFIKSYKPDVVFAYGIGLLSKNVLDILSDIPIINLHFGITPYYRSSDTLLWPLYLQQPGHIGYTLHAINNQIDHGPIYHQAKTVFTKDDSIHDVFCKTNLQAKDPAVTLTGLLMNQGLLFPITPKSSGKLFSRGEFTPNHLSVIYQLIDKGMFRKYLDSNWPNHPIQINSCIEEYLGEEL